MAWLGGAVSQVKVKPPAGARPPPLEGPAGGMAGQCERTDVRSATRDLNAGAWLVHNSPATHDIFMRLPRVALQAGGRGGELEVVATGLKLARSGMWGARLLCHSGR